MTDSLFCVRDQIVLVSGGSRGIGKALAAGFAARGATVVISGRELQTLQQTAQELGANVHVEVCDVAKKADIDQAVGNVVQKFGHIDTLINVAGVNRRKLSTQLSEDDWDFIVDINLKGAFFMSQAVGKQMVQRGKGQQINISSLNNDRPLLGVLPYAVSKAGMGHMTKSLAMEWGPKGVRVNAIAPGFVLTDLTRKLWSQPTMQAWGQTNTPLRRLGEPEDMIGAAIFLASAASAWMTGQTLYVDGGFTAGLVWPIDFGNQ